MNAWLRSALSWACVGFAVNYVVALILWGN